MSLLYGAQGSKFVRGARLTKRIYDPFRDISGQAMMKAVSHWPANLVPLQPIGLVSRLKEIKKIGLMGFCIRN